jgi:hypothetical protein
MSRAPRRDDLARRLERTPLPDATDAEQRAWAVVRAGAPPARAGRRRRRAPIAALLAVVGAAVALTPPGAAVGEWVRDRVDPPKPAAQPSARPASRLPAAGRLLVRDARGVAVVAQDGKRTRLGRYDGATWSPHGRFVAAWRGTRLTALTPEGEIRWQIDAPARIRVARWSLDRGYRIAYVTDGGRLRVVAGDGTGDRPLAATAAAAVPAWRPGGDHALAFVTAAGRLAIRDVDTGAAIERPRGAIPRGTRTLSWSAGGRLLAAAGPRAIRVFDLRAGGAHRIATRRRERFTAAAFSPIHPTLARIARLGDRATVQAGRELFATRGRIRAAAWSPDGRWLMLETPGQLVAVRVVGAPRVLTLPGARLDGWSR